jgi:hypothetical protein
MEVRQVDGAIPISLAVRELPLKLEDFSQKDMQNLLSTIIQTESKEDVKQELGSALIKATVEGFTKEGKLKLKTNNVLLIAEVETEKVFSKGEVVFLKVKSLYPRLELAIIKEGEVIKKLFNLLKHNFPFLLSGKVGEIAEIINDPAVRRVILDYLMLRFPEIHREIEKLLKSEKFLLKPQVFLILLLLLEDEVKENLRFLRKFEKKEIENLLEVLLSSYGLFFATSCILAPIVEEEGARSVVFFFPKDTPLSAFFEVESSFGKVGILIKVVGKEVGVEVFGSKKGFIKLREGEEELSKLLESEGLKLVYLKFGGESLPENTAVGVLNKKGILIDITV